MCDFEPKTLCKTLKLLPLALVAIKNNIILPIDQKPSILYQNLKPVYLLLTIMSSSYVKCQILTIMNFKLLLLIKSLWKVSKKINFPP